MDNIIIRKESPEDYEKIFKVVKAAFESADHSDGNEHFLVDRLRKSDEFVPDLSLVAEKDGKIVGHIMFTKIKIGNRTELALAPLSVSPEYQSMGIGSKLIERGHEIAREMDYSAIIVLGHEKYYPKFGYKRANDYNIRAPFEVSDENFMVLILNEKISSELSGVVQYSPAFFD